MCNPAIVLQRLYQSFNAIVASRSVDWSVWFLLSIGVTVGWAGQVNAESPETAPAELKQALVEIDTAASQGDVEEVMQFYSADFRNSDGLDRSLLQEALTQLWERYPDLNYSTELESWQREGDALIAQTVTRITGTALTNGLEASFESILRARQRYEDQKIVFSDILSEQTQLTAGQNPPQVEVLLPEQVRIGQEYNFDVIVQQPLGDNLLLGTALEEPITQERYLNPTELDLELLSAGGLFKRGRAPLLEEERWVSAVLIWGEGMIMITRRLQVVERPSTSLLPSQ